MTKHYYTISEVSNLLDVQAYILRYWESEIPVIRPKKSGHKRRYSIQQIETLKVIKDLLYNQRYTIEGARQKLKQDKNILQEARQEAVAKEKLKVEAAMPSIARDLLELKEKLFALKNQCKKYTGK
jgi:DNA-binding transcriptional MerR regulator